MLLEIPGFVLYYRKWKILRQLEQHVLENGSLGRLCYQPSKINTKSFPKLYI